MRLFLASALTLWAGQANAGFLDFFKRKPEEPEAEALTILGLDPVTFGLVVLAVIVFGAAIYYDPKGFLREIARGLGTFFGWVLGGVLALALGAGYYYLTGSVVVIGTVVAVLLLMIVVVMMRDGF